VRAARWSLVVAGVLVLGYGVAGLLTDPDGRPVGQAVFLAGLVVAHDWVFMPLVLGAGALVARVPAVARPAVRAAGIASLALGLVATPLVLGFGRRADDPSALPLPYGRNLAALLAVVWGVAAIHVAVRVAVGRRRERRRVRPRAGAR
jgi:hypothetical protein